MATKNPLVLGPAGIEQLQSSDALALGTPASGGLANCTGLPVSQGGVGAAATSASTGTISVTMNTTVVTITPSGACTFNATGGVAGQDCTFVITTSGSTTHTLTWGTHFKTTGTLATGGTSGKVFCVRFTCVDGTNWYETSRTTAM